MNNPSPLVPKGSLLDQKNRSRSRLRTAFLFIAGVHIIGLVTLLTVQGCKREQAVEPTADSSLPVFEADTNMPAADTNLYVPPAIDTNVVATTTTQVAPPATAGMTEYIIVKGDNFSTIGKKFGVTGKAIQEANPGVQPTKLQIGQKIMIPAPATPATGAATTTTTATSASDVYTVKSGDTLTSIANKYGVTINALRSENSLTTVRIKVGQKLKIPMKAPAAGSAPAPAAAPMQ